MDQKRVKILKEEQDRSNYNKYLKCPTCKNYLQFNMERIEGREKRYYLCNYCEYNFKADGNIWAAGSSYSKLLLERHKKENPDLYTDNSMTEEKINQLWAGNCTLLDVDDKVILLRDLHEHLHIDGIASKITYDEGMEGVVTELEIDPEQYRIGNQFVRVQFRQASWWFNYPKDRYIRSLRRVKIIKK